MLMKRRTWCGIAATALSAGIALGAVPACAGEWVGDPKSGCQVWNPNPQLGESVAWSGSCTNSRAEGHGIVRWSKNGTTSETDEGEWRDGQQVNIGTQSWSTGRYEGELSGGEPNGHGVLTMQKLKYEGDFRDGKPNGVGTLTVGSETVHGTWKDGCLVGARKASIGVPLSACH
jgi:MORN repeat